MRVLYTGLATWSGQRYPKNNHRKRGCLLCVLGLHTNLYTYTTRVFAQMKQIRKRRGRLFFFFFFCCGCLSAFGVVYTSVYHFIGNSHLGRRRGITPLEQSCRTSKPRTSPVVISTTGNSLVVVHRHDLIVYWHPGSRRGKPLQ